MQNKWSAKKTNAEQNQNRDFHRHIFNAVFLLTRHSSVFQIVPWNRKYLTNLKVQGKKAFWHVILHSYLCISLCKCFIKIESKGFSKTYSETESTWPINSSKLEIVLSRDSKELFVQRCESFWWKLKVRGDAKSKNRYTFWLYCTVAGLSESTTGGVV